MAKQSSQYNSFLGGEVSPLLWHRADMSQFGKWFANAENIRFTTMGAFENRPGFVRVGPVLDHQLKPVVKLIPFVFNNEEVFEIEFITGKFRVRKHGEVIIREDGSEVVYNSPIKIESLQQLKYAQSGDIIFIASGTSPVMELRRLKTDGTEWELAEFAGKLLPLGEENDDENLWITVDDSVTGEDVLYEEIPFDLKTDFAGYFGKTEEIQLNIKPINGQSFSITVQSIADINKNSLAQEYSLSYISDTKGSRFRSFGKIDSISFSVTRLPQKIEYVYLSAQRNPNDNTKITSFILNIPKEEDGFHPGYLPELETKMPIGKIQFNETDAEIVDCFYKDGYSDIVSTNYYWQLTLKGDAVSEIIKYGTYPSRTPVYLYSAPITKNFVFNFTKTGFGRPSHTISTAKDLILSVGEVIGIKHLVQGGDFDFKISSAGKTEYEPIAGSGKWRFYTNGNWVGTIKIYYSKDDKKEWRLLRTTISDGTKDPGIFNENTSGAIDYNGIIWYKMEANIGTIGTESGMGPLEIHFYTDSFEVNSYYQITGIKQTGEYPYYFAQCLKNNIGFSSKNLKWRKSAFSEERGYPESIGFYQNRLFFAKGYELWGSKINDFWDFYEPVELKKDDPINMSILTYKVNTIKNILTTKSFFIFTTGGEFGIASQGAISQDDKFLKQFSSHGSNDCTPLVVGNIVLFVDATGNTVRAFQYSFEADNYEATDITLFIEQKLKGKQIITAEYIRSTKECLFLDADGIVWVFKYMPEQNIMSWSHWKHGQYKITNLCVTPNGAYDELYIVADAPDGKFIERLDSSIYSDSVELYDFKEAVEEVQTQLTEGQIVNVDDGINNKYKATVGRFGKVKLRSPSKNVKIGLSYASTGTLLTPTIQLQDQTYTTYNKMKPFKVHFRYRDSFGFKVGVEEEEKMEVDFTEPYMDIESATALTSGKKSVLIPSKYDGSGRVSFVQDEPYPMLVENVYLEVDYGGK